MPIQHAKSSSPVIACEPSSGAARPPDLGRQLALLRPRLRKHGLELTRNRADAEDLVQDAIVHALSVWTVVPDLNRLEPPMRSLMQGLFYKTMRTRRETTDIEDLPDAVLSVPAEQEAATLLGELAKLMQKLRPSERDALLLSMEGMSGREIATKTSCARSTAHGRVSLARGRLLDALGSVDNKGFRRG